MRLQLAPILALVALVHPARAVPDHPLEPLDAAEIQAAADLTRAHESFPEGALFPLVALAEPSKVDVLRWKPGQPFRREAQVVVLDRGGNQTYEATVDLGKKTVRAWKPVPGAHPLVLIEEYDAVLRIVRADARWQAAMRKRGITDFSKVWVDAWAAGSYVPAGQHGARLLRAVSYMQDGAINYYARPIEGVIATVNLNSRQVVELIDTGPVPIAKASAELDEKSLGARAVAPLTITQPAGPGFTAKGHAVRWQNWSFRWAMHPREGLVLYDVRYQDGARARPVMYRGSLSEMVVPYGDPDMNWVWRNAFDEGEYGLGRLAAPIEPELDAPANAQLFDAVFANDFGKSYTLPRAVGIYERDAGILWKHYDLYHDSNQTRRARELVIFFITTIGNYDYSVSWVFRQDGSLGVSCDLTGIMLAKGVAATKVTAHHGLGHAHLVAPNVAAPHHQHFFNFRIDLDVDGQRNEVLEMDTRATPAEGPSNAITMVETPLTTERAAQRDLDMSAARKWRVGAVGVKGPMGYQPSYLLVPGGNAIPYIGKGMPTRTRAPFIEHAFFATRYKEGERHAASWYPNQSKGGQGLDLFAADDEKLAGADVVLWYTMGITHVPRPEEWPVMPVHRIGFDLLPAGFFARNPGLDVPRGK